MLAHQKNATRELGGPTTKAIRSLTREIRNNWTVGERHYRARLAMLLQYRLFMSGV